MQIQGTEIQIKEYQGKRVVTLKDIDAVHQRKSGTASRNFNQNRNVNGTLENKKRPTGSTSSNGTNKKIFQLHSNRK